jgi:predicted AAA+ superfamily ATPase
VLDEVQKVPDWSEIVKRHGDEDTAGGVDVRVVLLGSVPLLSAHGLAESLGGRFELIRERHWASREMRDACGWDLDRFALCGGYPGTAGLVDDVDRWRTYPLDSLVETTLARDILLLTRVDEPALLRQLFRPGCDYSAQVVSLTKLLGQLRDAGNTTTLAHDLHLLGAAGLLTGLQKFCGSAIRRRGSSPKLLALDTGLVAAMSGADPATIRGRGESWGRPVETAVGARLVKTAPSGLQVTWWREGHRAIDFVLSDGHRPLAIEVVSGRAKPSLPGLESFARVAPGSRAPVVGPRDCRSSRRWA